MCVEVRVEVCVTVRVFVDSYVKMCKDVGVFVSKNTKTSQDVLSFCSQATFIPKKVIFSGSFFIVLVRFINKFFSQLNEWM